MPRVLYAALFLAAGIIVGSSPGVDSSVWLACAAVSTGTAYLLTYHSRRSLDTITPAVRSASIALSLVLIGATRSAHVTRSGHVAAARMTAPNISHVEATVDGFSSNSSSYFRRGVAVEAICYSRTQGGADGLCAGPIGKAVLVVRDSTLASHLLPGSRILVKAKASAFRKTLNPFAFNYAEYLRRIGYVAEFRVLHSDSVQMLPASLSVPGVVSSLRQTIRRVIAEHVPGPMHYPTGRVEAAPASQAQAVLTALVLGDRTGLSSSVTSSFRDTGLMHLLAVSGLHVLIIGYSLYRFLGGVLLRLRFSWRIAERVRVAATMVFLLLYFLLAGKTVSIFRAIIMAAVFLSQHILRRRAILLNSLGVAAVIILFAHPMDLFSVGFQLSFCAVASLALLDPLPDHFAIPRWSRLTATINTLPPIPKRVASIVIKRVRRMAGAGTRSVASSFAATVGTMPILIYHFGFVSFAGIILNLVAIPLTAGALSAGVLCVVFALLGFTTMAAWFGSFSGASIDLLIYVTQKGHHWGSQIALSLQWPGLTVAGLVLSTLAFYATRKYLTIRWKLATAIVAVFLIVQTLKHVVEPPSLELVFLGIGQGDAVLVRSPENKILLVDTGPQPYRPGSTAEIISGFLDHWNVSTIDLAILTHPHTDHIGGMNDILQSIPVDQIIDNGVPVTVDAYLSYRSAADSTDTPLKSATIGALIPLSRSLYVEVLGPDSARVTPNNLNNGSVVVRVVFGSTCALLTGDIERAAEQFLVQKYGRSLACEVVKIPHHGSKTSSSIGFVESTSVTTRSYAVVSVASRNSFGLPDDEALDRWRESGDTVLTTTGGAIWLRSNGRRFSIRDWR